MQTSYKYNEWPILVPQTTGQSDQSRQFISTKHRSVYFDQSQVSLFRPNTGQFISTNHKSVYSDQSQTIHQTSGQNKRRPHGALKSYLNDLQRWLSERRIAINVSKSTAIIFARAGRRFIQP